jgi:hypothetical protein
MIDSRMGIMLQRHSDLITKNPQRPTCKGISYVRGNRFQRTDPELTKGSPVYTSGVILQK